MGPKMSCESGVDAVDRRVRVMRGLPMAFVHLVLVAAASGCGGSGSAQPVAPSPTADPFNLTACTNITQPGSYTVATDLTGRVNNAGCLVVNASDVSVDCRGRRVTALTIGAVANVSITNCSIGVGASPVPPTTYISSIQRATNVTLSNNDSLWHS